MKINTIIFFLSISPLLINADSGNREFLKEQFKEGEYELFPKMRRHIGKFIEIFNHPKIQNKILTFSQKFDLILTEVNRARSEVSLIRGLKSLAEFLDRKLSSIQAFQQIKKCGFFALVNDNRFWFLSEDIATLDGAEMFLRFWEGKPMQCINQAFEEYFKSWTFLARRLHWYADAIIKELKSMRDKKNSVAQQSDEELLQIFKDIIKYLTPVINKILKNITLLFPKFRTINLIGDAVRQCYHGLEICKKTVKVHIGFFLNFYGLASLERLRLSNTFYKGNITMQCAESDMYNPYSTFSVFSGSGSVQLKEVPFIKDFLLASEDDKMWYLQEDMLEIVDEFSKLFHRLISFINNNHHLLVNEKWVLGEVDRISKFLYDMILRNESNLNNRTELMTRMIQRTVGSKNGGFLPFITVVNPFMEENDNPQIRLTFILPFSKNTGEILRQLRQWFDNRNLEIVQVKNTTILLNIDLEVDQKLTFLVCRTVSRLSNLSLRALLAGTYGLANINHTLNPHFNRVFGTERVEGFLTKEFTQPVFLGNTPYYGISGWRRFGVQTGLNSTELKEISEWPVAYHGTYGHRAATILNRSFKASFSGTFLNSDMTGCVYLTPSVEYAAFPRYAREWKIGKMYFQMVLQVRVRKDRIYLREAGTVPGTRALHPTMDPNMLNNTDLEWMIKWPPNTYMTSKDGLVVTGMMLRVSEGHPGFLKNCAWWEPTRGYGPVRYWDYF